MSQFDNVRDQRERLVEFCTQNRGFAVAVTELHWKQISQFGIHQRQDRALQFWGMFETKVQEINENKTRVKWKTQGSISHRQRPRKRKQKG